MKNKIMNFISENIKKAVEMIEKRRPLHREQEAFTAKPMIYNTPPEQYAAKELAEITNRHNELKVMRNGIAAAVRAMKTNTYTALYPDARQIMNQKAQSDIWILEKGFVFTPAELANIRKDYINPANPVMLRVIERYAKEHFPKNAKEFEFETVDAEKYIKALDALVQLADEAFEDAYGPAADTLEGFINLATGEPDVEKFIEWANTEKDSEKE